MPLTLPWLVAVVAQSALLVAYWRARVYRWWAWSLAPGILFTPIIAAFPDGSYERYWTWALYQVIRSILTIAAVLEARDSMTIDPGVRRFGTLIGAVIAAAWCLYRLLTTDGGICTVVLTALGGVSSALLGAMLAVFLWTRTARWPLHWPASVHLPLLLLMAATIARGRWALWMIAAVQAVGAVAMWRGGRGSRS